MNRELRAAVGLCLAGAAALLVAGGRTWATVEGDAPAPLPAVTTALTGAELVPGLRALALVGLAGVAALPATRPRWRPLVGLLLAAVGLGAALLVGGVLADAAGTVRDAVPGADVRRGAADLGLAPLLALLGALLLLLAGLLALVRGRRWATLGARYEAPAPRARPAEASAWDALDRGDDPTAADPTAADPTTVPTPDRNQEESP